MLQKVGLQCTRCLGLRVDTGLITGEAVARRISNERWTIDKDLLKTFILFKCLYRIFLASRNAYRSSTEYDGNPNNNRLVILHSMDIHSRSSISAHSIGGLPPHALLWEIICRYIYLHPRRCCKQVYRRDPSSEPRPKHNSTLSPSSGACLQMVASKRSKHCFMGGRIHEQHEVGASSIWTLTVRKAFRDGMAKPQ